MCTELETGSLGLTSLWIVNIPSLSLCSPTHPPKMYALSSMMDTLCEDLSSAGASILLQLPLTMMTVALLMGTELTGVEGQRLDSAGVRQGLRRCGDGVWCPRCRSGTQ